MTTSTFFPDSAQTALHATTQVREHLAIDTLLYEQLDHKASDLHLNFGEVPWMTRYQEIQPVPGDREPFDGAGLERLLRPMVTEESWARLQQDRRLDFGYETERSRFRVHIAYAGGAPYAVFREIAHTLPAMKDLGLPQIVSDLKNAQGGLHLFVGETNSGKSTTQNAIIEARLNLHAKKIVMLEAPTEYLHRSAKGLVVQREVGRGADSHSFPDAIEDAMREAPDMIVISEMRDAATIMAAITAASSGHMVFASLHAESAADVPTRILDAMPPGRVNDVRSQLARSLKTVVRQRLLPTKRNEGVALAVEVMKTTPIIAGMIRENSLGKIQEQMRLRNSESISYEDSLATLVLDDKVNRSTAEAFADTPAALHSALSAGRRVR